MLAGLMLATSCSKDDGTSVVDEAITTSPEHAVGQPVAKRAYPLTIQATRETSFSKISLGGDGLSQVFDAGEKLTLVCVDEGVDLSIPLSMVSGAGTTSAVFSIDDMGEEAVGKTFRAEIKGTEYADGVKYSTTSLAEAVHKYCYLRAAADFTYTEGATIPTLSLVDQRAYIAFTVADGQKKVSLKKSTDADYSWYPVKDNKVWFVVNGGETYSTRLKKTELTAEKSKVYSVTETDVVDLGLSVLWKNTNEAGYDEKGWSITYNQSDKETSPYKDEYYFDWNYAGGVPPLRLPSKAELEDLAKFANNIYWGTWNGMICKMFSNEYGELFFPAAGGGGGGDAGNSGAYWSYEEARYPFVYYLYCEKESATLQTINPITFTRYLSTRLVRDL